MEDNTIELYKSILSRNKFPINFKNTISDKIKNIVKCSFDSLLYDFHSDFIDLCVAEVKKYYEKTGVRYKKYIPKSFGISKANESVISSYDMMLFLDAFYNYSSMDNFDFLETDNKFKLWIEKQVGHELMISQINEEFLYDVLLEIDNYLIAKHNKIHGIYKSLIVDNSKDKIEALEKEISKIKEAAHKEAVEKKQKAKEVYWEVFSEADAIRNDAEESGKNTIKLANSMAERQKRDADNYSENKISETNKNCEKMIEEAKAKADEIYIIADQKRKEIINSAEKRSEELRARITSAQAEEGKRQIDEYLKKIEGLVSDTDKVLEDISRSANDTAEYLNNDRVINLYQYLEDLYHNINLVKKDIIIKDEQSQIYSDNLQVFLDMIVDILSSNGIETIHSDHGIPFNGRIHEAYMTNDFDPDNSCVDSTVECGFMFEQRVLKKEQVRLQ